MSWIQDLVNPETRQWEEFYRNRWQHDRAVRSTHGVNCTGGCSWMVYVKDGIITWELQATDYPALESGLPPYEPRGCQRGISFSWYIYSPIRVKYPYIRGTLVDMWREAKAKHSDPVEAWTSIVEDEDLRSRYQRARGKGGFRRTSWEEVLEIIGASTVHTVKKYGADRVNGFSPIPAMSFLSYAGGSRFLQLFGGVNLSFYDWYSDLPNASPEIWGEQTDVCESADWFNSKYIAVMGSNLNMTRTPDVHFISEARHNGSKMVVFSPDESQVSKFADWWVPVNAGQDGAFWMGVNHVILKEFHYERQTPYFIDYVKRYTDSPFLIVLKEKDGGYAPSRLLHADQLERYRDEENSGWKYLVIDKTTGQPRSPQGTIGFRWQTEKGKWNLEMKDGLDGSEIDPTLTLLDDHDEILQADFTEFASGTTFKRGVPVKYIQTAEGKIPVTTIYDLLMAQYGVDRGLEGDYPQDYDDEDTPYTPAWQERFTGIDRKTVLQFAREWASTAEKTKGQCMIIIGAGINHWYHNNLIYRSGIAALMLCGCVGRNGGGLNHYVGQEKLAPVAPWSTIAFASDWVKPPRLQNSPSFHYVHTDQWRYEGSFTDYHTVPQDNDLAQGHTVDLQARAVRMGWLPFYPQFNRNPMELVREAEEAGAKNDEEIIEWVVQQLKERKLQFSVEDPDAPENWPRMLFIWRGNALMSSSKGHEYFLKHYLGTHNNAIADEIAEDTVHEVKWHEKGPQGKLDLVVDINFRMDTSALYSDIVLPTATWYEKDDLNSTDLHSYIHPLSAAVPPCWESKSDWEIFKSLAKKVSELAEVHFPETVREIVASPLLHDTPAELAQPEVKDWVRGECDPVPGKTMPNLAVAERNLKDLYHQYISLGPGARRDGIGAHGVSWSIEDQYDEMVETGPTVQWNGHKLPSLDDALFASLVDSAGRTGSHTTWVEAMITNARQVEVDQPFHRGKPLFLVFAGAVQIGVIVRVDW